MNTIYALLVGIDRYPDSLARLYGCCNDIDAFHSYLQARFGGEAAGLKVHVLQNETATRQAVIDGFRQHLGQATNEDVALFYFAGHGSQQLTAPGFWHVEPDRWDETLVCWDSRTEGSWDLTDKEIAALIQEVTPRGGHTTVILDCCHSGSGTRDSLAEVAARWIPPDERPRPQDGYIVRPDQLALLPPHRGASRDTAIGWELSFPGRHILLAACRSEEKAREYKADGIDRGAFSYFLLTTLVKTARTPTYRDLFARTVALLKGNVAGQSPQLEAYDPRDLDRPFLGGHGAQCSPAFRVHYDREAGWVLDAGRLHGIPEPADGETAVFALFPFDATDEEMQETSRRVNEAMVAEVFPTRSRVRVAGDAALDRQETFKARMTSLPLPPLRVRILGEPWGVQLAEVALARSAPGERPSPYIRAVSRDEQYRVLARDGGFHIARPVDDKPLVAFLEGYAEATARAVVRRLEHIARWQAIAELSNPGSRIPPDAVGMTIYRDGAVVSGPEIVLEYRPVDGGWRPPTFQVKLENRDNRRYYCALVALSESFAVYTGFFPEGAVLLEPGSEAWAYPQTGIPATVPDRLFEAGITKRCDILKRVVSTREFDPRLLEQPALDEPLRHRATAGAALRSPLNRLMDRIHTRELAAPAWDEPLEDWEAAEIVFTTIRPQPAIRIVA